jgi:predicted metal-dependent hydrolase
MRSEITNYIKQISQKLNLWDVKLEITDLWAMGIEAWGLADKKENSICLHCKQIDWQDTVRHELAHLAAKALGHGKEFQTIYNSI